MTTQAMTTQQPDWGYLLDGLCEVAGVSHALAVSGDGLLIAASRQVPQEFVDQLAATTSGLASLTKGQATLMNAGEVEHTLVEMTAGSIVVMAIGNGSHLTVLAAKRADLGQVVYEMAALINRAGSALTPALRPALTP
ncbi:roadblock/LC7 domain-containing protein [Phytohabitans kaempferiae]|uniref:Roadblock/LC7 domain-containing protein n=1 Tax=Phytohabitans kaempferiae TaxID=1620943 RepID=A0ABV6MBH3_9ACTN